MLLTIFFIYINFEDITKIYSIIYKHKKGICIVVYYTGISITKILYNKFNNRYIKQPYNNLKEKISLYLERNGFTKHTVILKGNKYDVTLNINNKIYKLLIKKIRPPNNNMQIIDENENDITGEVEPYLLAQQTIITELTPNKLGKKSLHFPDKGLTFNEDDIIL